MATLNVPVSFEELFPPPIDSLDELRVLLQGRGQADRVDEERVTAGIVTLAAVDPSGVTRTLTEAAAKLRETGQTNGEFTWFPPPTRLWPRT